MQRRRTFGGGVSRRNTRLRGQSIIEYVLIAAVIGLVVIFAGPQVSGAIRNQFNQVTNTVDSGTDGDSFMSAEEKAYREAMKTLAGKEAKDWTLDEQKAAATDIAKNGASSVVYAKAKAAVDAGTKWSVKLTTGETMEYRIIGINHDDLADGSGKAGLTFLAATSIGNHRMNSADTNVGGWEASELRTKMNSGEIWNLMPSGLQNEIRAVKKLTDNLGGGKAGTPSATVDRLFSLSTTEIWGDIDSDGSQYEYYHNRGVTKDDWYKATVGPGFCTRSVDSSKSNSFRYAISSGNSWNVHEASRSDYVCPAFCF